MHRLIAMYKFARIMKPGQLHHSNAGGPGSECAWFVHSVCVSIMALLSMGPAGEDDAADAADLQHTALKLPCERDFHFVGLARLLRRLHGRASADEQLGHLLVPLEGGEMEWSDSLPAHSTCLSTKTQQK